MPLNPEDSSSSKSPACAGPFLPAAGGDCPTPSCSVRICWARSVTSTRSARISLSIPRIASLTGIPDSPPFPSSIIRKTAVRARSDRHRAPRLSQRPQNCRYSSSETRKNRTRFLLFRTVINSPHSLSRRNNKERVFYGTRSGISGVRRRQSRARLRSARPRRRAGGGPGSLEGSNWHRPRRQPTAEAGSPTRPPGTCS